MTIVFASNNKEKIKEVKSILSDFNVLSLSDIGFADHINESGITFSENSFIKAKTVSLVTSYPVLADDSGLSCEALGGLPGVHSKRFSKEGTSLSNNLLLLDKLKEKTNRNASFICSMTFIYKDKIINEEAKVNGIITKDFRGPRNFGYDPLFLIPKFNKTLAELGPIVKNKLSHRALALNKIKGKIYEILSL